MSAPRRLTWDGVLAWRMRRQLLDPVGQLGLVETVARLCGVQAQVQASAELAVALRRSATTAADVRGAVGARRLMRTWAMRGTLHLLAPGQAGAVLALIAQRRSWERPAWERSFGVSAAEVARLADLVDEILAERVLTREQLIDEIAARTASRDLDEHLRSGWGAVLKPLAWTGHLCNGPSDGNRVTFTSPGHWLEEWRGLPDPMEAARTVIPAYLGAYGPASPRTFDNWLTRNASRAADLRRWFAAAEDLLVQVDVEGELLWAVAEHVEELVATPPSRGARLLGGFDQYLLGPGTADPRIVAPARRREVSKAAGWIAPVLIYGGRVVATWMLERDRVVVSSFPELEQPARVCLEAEVARVGACLGATLTLA